MRDPQHDDGRRRYENAPCRGRPRNKAGRNRHACAIGLPHHVPRPEASAREGKTVKATLKFDKAGSVDVEYPILAVGATAPGTASGGGMKMKMKMKMKM